jgi:hypothetical protein
LNKDVNELKLYGRIIFLLFGMGFSFQAFLRIPMYGFGRRHWIFLVLTVISIIFLDKKYRSICLSFSMFMAGVAGLTYIGLLYLDCGLGQALGGKICFSDNSYNVLQHVSPLLSIIIPLYCGYVVIGVICFIIMKRFGWVGRKNIRQKRSIPHSTHRT